MDRIDEARQEFLDGHQGIFVIFAFQEEIDTVFEAVDQVIQLPTPEGAYLHVS